MKHSIKSIIKSTLLIILYLLSAIFIGNKTYFESSYESLDNYNISKKYDDTYIRITKKQYTSGVIYFVIPEYRIYWDTFDNGDIFKINNFGNESPIYEKSMHFGIHEEVENPSNLYNVFFGEDDNYMSVAKDALCINPENDNHKSIYTALTDNSKLPSNTNEIALTDVIFDMYSLYGMEDSDGNLFYPKDYSDLIGKEYKTSDKTYKISGIFSTMDSEKYKASKDIFMSNDKSRMTMELLNLKFAYQHIIFDEDKESSSRGNSHTAIVKLTGSESTNKNFLSSFRSTTPVFGMTLHTFIFGWGMTTTKMSVDVFYTSEYHSKIEASRFFSYNYVVSVIGVVSYLLFLILFIVFLCQWFRNRFRQIEFKPDGL